ncbi:hypothetical protein [Pseudomonas poae]|uniref:hypothetical protein n=1 Tax=Pseudomonas poae TaxID=200451 RepID=UPI0011CDCC7C|nr:hypothetical protein [Pseudomonas poae]
MSEKIKLSNPKQLLDLDQLLPGGGENRFEIFYSGTTLNLDIFYDAEDPSLGEIKKSIRFLKVTCFFKQPFPGYSFFSCKEDSDISTLGSLVEYGHSDMIAMRQGKELSSDDKHYRLFLHSVGAALYVIANSVDI